MKRSASESASAAPLCVDTSREDFFANWETDDANYESRVKTIKRRFPGPAGLLPAIPLDEVKNLDDSEHPLSQHISKIISADLMLQRQQAESPVAVVQDSDREILRINKKPWRELIKVLQLNPRDPIGLISLMNIRWVKSTVCRHPVTTKIPFLALVIQEEPEILAGCNKQRKGAKDRRKKNPSIKFMDPTGSIVAAMDVKFVEAFAAQLAPGTALAVKDCGFLRFRRQVILTVTRKNIICMTSLKKSVDDPYCSETNVKFSSNQNTGNSIDEMNSTIKVTETPEGVKVMRFSEFDCAQAVREYEAIRKQDQILKGLVESTNEGENDRHVNEPGPRNPTNPSKPPQETVTHIAASSAGHNQLTPQANFSVDFDAFGNDDDDELFMLALETADLDDT